VPDIIPLVCLLNIAPTSAPSKRKINNFFLEIILFVQAQRDVYFPLRFDTLIQIGHRTRAIVFQKGLEFSFRKLLINVQNISFANLNFFGLLQNTLMIN